MLTEAKSRKRAETLVSSQGFPLVDKHTKFLSNIMRCSDNWPEMREAVMEQFGLSEDLMPPAALETEVAAALQTSQRRSQCTLEQGIVEQSFGVCRSVEQMQPASSSGAQVSALPVPSGKDALDVSTASTRDTKRSVGFTSTERELLEGGTQIRYQTCRQGSARKSALKTFVHGNSPGEQPSKSESTVALRGWNVSEKSLRGPVLTSVLRSELGRKRMRLQYAQAALLVIISAFIEPCVSSQSVRSLVLPSADGASPRNAFYCAHFHYVCLTALLCDWC
jgi:hypothetical protein